MGLLPLLTCLAWGRVCGAAQLDTRVSAPTLLAAPVQGLIFVEVDGQHVVINMSKSGKVQCADAALKGRVDKALDRMKAALEPVPCDLLDT